MTRINATITASDDNNLIFETRGGRGTTRVIPRDGNAATALFAAVEAAIAANTRPQPQSAPAAPEQPAKE